MSLLFENGRSVVKAAWALAISPKVAQLSRGKTSFSDFQGKEGRLFVVSLEGKIYSCKYCQTHLALCEDIFSKSFHCRRGKAYLFNKVVNVSVGEKEERMMMTGMHIVAHIFCVGCGSIVGWKYESANEKGQKYKEGKFILEV
ncbi:hypothetical protein NE237_009494 [Protea cynaroides]|uniref:Protein yippee-like n=1 Tax=Protea cynaroides TaxID=273540 RepID=A0A9Q0KYP0_9MAGN|nr:hypothetical protein NE237_009494 [Protea cynaroides]